MFTKANKNKHSMMSRILYTLTAILLMTATTSAQEVWSLEKCINHAWGNSLSIKQTEIATRNAELTEKGNRLSRYPSVNGSGSFGYQFGLAVDPITNTLKSSTLGFNSLSINANATIYNGGRITNSIKQSEYDVKAAQADAAQTRNDIALNVATTYLNVLFAEEQLANAQQRLTLTQEQLAQTDRLIAAGALPANDRLDVLAQVARDEQTIVTQQNTVDLSYFNLKNILELTPDYDLAVERPDVDVPAMSGVEGLTLDAIYQQALQTQPFIQAGELRLRSAELAVDIAHADLLPRLTAFAGIDSRYSTKGVTVIDRQTVFIPQDIIFNGTTATVEFPQEIPVVENAGYFTQLNDNLGQQVGLSLSVPIYNNRRAQIAKERAELNIINTQITNQRNLQQLKSDIQTAIANAKAAKKALDASEKTVNALRAAYKNAEKRYTFGAINTFTLTTAKSNLDTAEVDYIVAKYDYLFKLKIVEYYQGEQLDLK